MSKFKLAKTLKCTVKEADALIIQYFNTFPQIKRTLTQFGYFALDHGYTQSLAPFFRKRWFPTWESLKSKVAIHKRNIEYNSGLGRIERQAKNHPIQGSGGDLIKLAMWMVYKFIRDNNLQDKIHILLNVHDQLTTACTSDLTDWWVKELDRLMCEAGKVVIPSGMLKAETTRSKVWTK